MARWHSSLLWCRWQQIKGIGGFTILGSGEVALILDVPGLRKQVMGEEPLNAHRRVLALNEEYYLLYSILRR